MKNTINKVYFSVLGILMMFPGFAMAVYSKCENYGFLYRCSRFLSMLASIFCLLSVFDYLFNKQHRKLDKVVFVIGIILFLFEYFVIREPLNIMRDFGCGVSELLK